MRNTIISVAMIIVIALCACSRAAADRCNLVIENRQETAEIYSIAVSTQDSTTVGQNADNSALKVNSGLDFDMGNMENCAFDVAVADENGRILCIGSFNISFEYGVKRTLYVVAESDGALRITTDP